MILDEYLPEADVSERHAIVIPTACSEVYRALSALRLSEISPIVKLLLALRDAPSRLFGAGHPRRSDVERPLLPSMIDEGFLPLADTNEEIVLGMIGQPWRLARPKVMSVQEPAEFLAFSDPTMAKIAFNLYLRAVDGGTHLSTETRVRIVDARARRQFKRYWTFIHPGSALIRILWLRAAARKATAMTRATSRAASRVEGGAA